MSLGYPPLRPVPEGSTKASFKEDIYGLPNVMLHGFHKVKEDLTASHPLEYSEKNWDANREQMDFTMLRNMQGIHAPLRLNMERRTAAQMRRLPCLPSSNIMLNSLTGKLDTVDFDDVLNNPMEFEVMGQPHAMLERQMKLI